MLNKLRPVLRAYLRRTAPTKADWKKVLERKEQVALALRERRRARIRRKYFRCFSCMP